MTSHRQRAQATIWFVLITLTLGLLFGLSADTGVLFAEHRRAEQLADSAARAASSAIDEDTLRRTGQAQLDPVAAEQTARQFVLDQDASAVVQPSATTHMVTVEVRLQVPTTIAHPPGQSTVEVVSDGVAHPAVGLATPNP